MDEKQNKERVRMAATMDQASQLMADIYPMTLHAFYVKCVEAGFEKGQAMALTERLLDRLTVAFG